MGCVRWDTLSPWPGACGSPIWAKKPQMSHHKCCVQRSPRHQALPLLKLLEWGLVGMVARGSVFVGIDDRPEPCQELLQSKEVSCWLYDQIIKLQSNAPFKQKLESVRIGMCQNAVFLKMGKCQKRKNCQN